MAAKANHAKQLGLEAFGTTVAVRTHPQSKSDTFGNGVEKNNTRRDSWGCSGTYERQLLRGQPV